VRENGRSAQAPTGTRRTAASTAPAVRTRRPARGHRPPREGPKPHQYPGPSRLETGSARTNRVRSPAGPLGRRRLQATAAQVPARPWRGWDERPGLRVRNWPPTLVRIRPRATVMVSAGSRSHLRTLSSPPVRVRARPPSRRRALRTPTRARQDARSGTKRETRPHPHLRHPPPRRRRTESRVLAPKGLSGRPARPLLHHRHPPRSRRPS